MSSKISPQQAYEAAKLLWPGTFSIMSHRSSTLSFFAIDEFDHTIVSVANVCVDWPSGVDRWPMPEPKWRDAQMPDDYGKPARFSNGGGTHDEVFCGMLPSGEHRYIDQNAIAWKHCQVRCSEHS